MHLRKQVVLFICAAQLVALTVTISVVVLNAREAVRLEIESAEKSARALMLTTIGYALQKTAPSEVLPQLADAIVAPRHVDISLIDPSRGPLPVRKLEAEEDGSAPDWFARLVTPPPREIHLPIGVSGTIYGYVSIAAAPRDEIAEVWSDIASLFWIVAVTAIISALAMAALVTRALKPLDKMRDALGRLRQGDFSTRIGQSSSADLASIFQGFDALSEALETAQADRDRLNRRIVELGDAERRAIAMELHDELGPCLFGLKVKANAIAQSASAARNEDLARDAETIQTIVATIQAANARLLTTLRPMAIGQLPLVDALADLFDAFRKTHPGVDWNATLPSGLSETAETLDLTVYRFFQEGITNALRHGQPGRVTLALAEHSTPDGPVLCCTVEDDGLGMVDDLSEGRGLTAMRDRINAVGGSLIIDKTEGGGLRLQSKMPVLAPLTGAPELRAAS